MITRACISINNCCNLHCKYCHFHEKQTYIKESKMDVFLILDHIKEAIRTQDIPVFTLGFVGNGEPLLDFDRLSAYIRYLSSELKSKKLSVYTITNGLLVTREILEFFKAYQVNLGFSIDGIPEIHNPYRCHSHAKVMEKIELFREVFGRYPSMNCTVGKETLEHAVETIEFFRRFENRITFSRMIGRYGITLEEFHKFLTKVKTILNVRKGSYDCTMYGGLCGAGMNNFFFANGNVYLCGNCIDLGPIGDSGMPFAELEKISLTFDRTHCYKETICG